MASGPNTSWEIDGETVETVADLSKITADGDCSHEIKRRLLLGRKVVTNLDSILKSRDITLPTKVHLVKAIVYPVVMYGCERWTVKKVKEEREKVGLKLNIQKTKIMASGPITSWQIDRETMETVADFILLGSKITADGDCSHEIKRHLLLRRKVMINLDSILKSRDITLSTKVRLVKAMVFPVVMYGCESWTIKKAEHQRIEAFELWFWRRLLRVP